mmetsp:Transcript_1152/g.3053  ORF Transcript_1152/g.3053 Transcript_1152/m.3053 type:complete len:135 (-) Transcript_1152:398-802(-)
MTDTFPVKRLASETTLTDGRSVHIQLQFFSTRTVLLVTESGRISTWVVGKSSMVQASPTFDVALRFGPRDDPLPELLCRQVTEKFFQKGYRTDLLLGYYYKPGPHVKDDLRVIINAVDSLLPAVKVPALVSEPS